MALAQSLMGRTQPFASQRWPRMAAALLALALLGAALAFAVAQVAGNRGIAPVASSADIAVNGIKVDVRAASPAEAREKAWREAQRIAWQRLGGPSLPDSEIESLLTAVVIEREQASKTRYTATLGIIFDRARASRYLGGGEVRGAISAPMLLLPVTASAGSHLVYEVRNPWQRAWAEFQPGTSPVNYVRPSGSGGDSLLLTYGQTGRRSRLWWRTILDQFGAADVLVAVAALHHQWPGGPIKGEFTARYGPDNRFLGQFTLEAANPAALPEMLAQATGRFDALFQQALADGKLRPDPTLDLAVTSQIDPALQRLIEIGRMIEEREAAIAAGEILPGAAGPIALVPQPSVVAGFVVQFASPDARSVDATLADVRSASGVRAAATTSIAIGGTSVMTVSFAGSLDELAAALRARGYTVQQGPNALAISR